MVFNYWYYNDLLYQLEEKITIENLTKPAWAGFKTAEEGRAKNM